MNSLLPNETVIKRSSDNSIVLSNYRITLTAGGDFMSICLDKVSCIKIHYSSKDYYLVIGALAGLLGLGLLLQNEGQTGLLVLVVAGIFIGLYFRSKRHLVSIFSDSGQSLDFTAKGDSKVMEFISKVEEARIEYPKAIRIESKVVV